MPLHVDLITPEKQAFSDDVDFIAAPGADGEIGILPHHAPLLARLGVGELRLRKGDEIRYFALTGGFLQVQEGSRVSVFAETAELAQEIDTERAAQAAERAKNILRKPGEPDLNLLEAEMALNRALLRLKVSRLRGGSSKTPQPSTSNLH